MDVNNVFGTLPIIQSAKKCKRNTGWKPSVQSYQANIVVNSRKSSKEVLTGTWKTKGFHEFDIIERGKPRHIKSVNFEERCLQRSLCDNFVTPILSHYLIYDNSATLKNKGTDFALNRLTKHLQDFYRKYGRDGYIFFYDFSQYFASIDIETLKEMTNRYIPDCLMRNMYHQFIDVFQEDGLGLGSQVSQISAVFYANSLDHLLKDTLGIKYYARDIWMMGYIIEHDLQTLKYYISRLKDKCNELGIVLNEKKCHIIRLTRQFRFLKIRFFITQTGKVIRRLHRQVVSKERHKLIKFKSYLEQGKMTSQKIQLMFHGWAYSQKRGKNYHILYNMISYYNSLFNRYETVKPKGSKTLKQYHTINYICKFTK